MRNYNTNTQLPLKFIASLAILLFAISSTVQAQITGDNGETLLGNEWIDYDQEYFKLMVAEDGVYRVTASELTAAGVPLDQISGSTLKLFHFGQEQYLHVSNNGNLSQDDYIEFVGVKNRGELDQHLYSNPDDMLNPEYSLYTDTTAYFLTWDDTPGKRYEVQQTDLSGNTLSPEEYYWAEDLVVFNDRLHKPIVNSDNIRFSGYLEAEGYASRLLKVNQYDHNVTEWHEGVTEAQLNITLSGNNVEHIVDISVNNQLISTEQFAFQRKRNYQYALNSNQIEQLTRVKIESKGEGADNNVISLSQLIYPRKFAANNASHFRFSLEASSTSRYIELERLAIEGALRIYSSDLGLIIDPVIEDGVVKFIVPPTSSATKWIVENVSQTNDLSIEKREFVNYSDFSNTQFIIITSQVFDQDHTDGVNYIRAYKDHRESQNGGSYPTHIVYVEDLYDQFAYGVHRHPLSLKNFAHWVKDNWTDARFNFLVGKGKDYDLSRTKEQLQDDGNPTTYNFYVPSYGLPSSDNSLMALKGHSRPLLPTGRIAVGSISRLKAYYDKIVLREDPNNYPQSIEGKQWTKNVIHLAGGNAPIQASLRETLRSMANTLENNRFGANVIAFEKKNSDNISASFSEKLKKSVNDGAALISFFGHASPSIIDFNLEEAQAYSNRGKLPVFFSMGCYSGNLFTDYESISEDLVLEEEVGTIAFIASGGTAYITPQGVFGREYYSLLGTDLYNRTLGEQIHSLLETHDTSNIASVRTLNEQFTLHGDPALNLYSHRGPDFAFDYSSTSIIPSSVTPEIDSVEMEFNIVNLGEGIDDSLELRLIHKLADGTIIDTLTKRVLAPRYASTERISFANPGMKGFGQNCLDLELDYNNSIVEQPSPVAENNNVLGHDQVEQGFCFFIFDDAITPISPKEYAIVNDAEIELFASTSNILAEDRDYVFQLDTTANFDSPDLIEHRIENSSGLVSWRPEVTFEPNRVYYWRARPEGDGNVESQWRSSSFVYLPNSSPGWNQSHYYQFIRNDLSRVEYEGRKLDYVDKQQSMVVNAKVDSGDDHPRILIDGNAAFKTYLWELQSDGLIIVKLNKLDAFWIENQSPGLHGSQWNGVSTQRMFFYPTDDQQSRIGFVNHLRDVVEDGEHVLVFTVTNKITADLNIEEWALDSLVNDGKNIFNTLELKGAEQVRLLQERGTVPYAFAYTEGSGPKDENIANDILSIANIAADFPISFTEGSVSSPLIGPASNWSKAVKNLTGVMDDDEYYIQINGVKSDGSQDSLLSVTLENEVDLSAIDANEYPYIQFHYFSRDNVNRTPVQIAYWRVLFDGVAEFAFVKDDTYQFKSDTLNQGENLFFNAKAINIGKSVEDSLHVSYTFTNSDNQSIEKTSKLIENGNGWYDLEIEQATEDMKGNNTFEVLLNSNDGINENYKFNNLGLKSFYVRVDDRNPNLDVTFDGLHIINGDIVSPEPNILIEIRDDNPYLLLDQDDIFTLKLVDPNGNVTDYTVEESEVSFEPATDASNNKAKIIFNPKFETEGTYKMIVQAKDASGNFSGKNDYVVEFEVILSESISNIFNYPNPFSTSTQFVFTLTGSQVPDDLSITILTISGKVVKEITREELGNLRIGHNRTAYKWDGTDEYGEKLANGVYLYKINLPKDMERYNTGTDQFFEKDFGKLVIMR